MEKLVEAMKRYFATNFQYYMKAHGYHVNVVGPDFTEYHQLFEKIYDDAQDSIDSIAEQIRACEGIAPFNSKRIAELGDIEDATDVPEAKKMAEVLLEDTQVVVNHIEECYDIAGEEGQYGLQNFLADRMDKHRKYQWMLRATLGKQ